MAMWCVTNFRCLCVCVCVRLSACVSVSIAAEVLLTQHCPASWAPPQACLPASCPATINFEVPHIHTCTSCTHTDEYNEKTQLSYFNSQRSLLTILAANDFTIIVIVGMKYTHLAHVIFAVS